MAPRVPFKEKIRSESFNATNSFNDDINPILQSILTYPIIKRKPKKTKKTLELPHHMTSEESMRIFMLKEEEKRREEIAKEARRQKRLENAKKSKGKPKKRKISKTTEVRSERKSRRTVKKPRYLVEEEEGEGEEVSETDSEYIQYFRFCLYVYVYVLLLIYLVSRVRKLEQLQQVHRTCLPEES